jgi:uncharacterized protein YdaU (DUF1376 family)
MGRFTPIRVNYVAFYFREWLYATSIMSTIERGIYSSLVFHIYEAGGRLEHKTELLASICGLTELEFSTHWSKLKHKFVQTGDYLYHKRCTLELRKTDSIIKSRRKGGLLSAKTRKDKGIEPFVKKEVTSKSVPTHFEQYNETNTIQNNNITNTSNNPVFQKTLDNMKVSDSFSKSSSTSDSSREGDKLLLYGALQDFFNIRSNADRTALDNICKWAVNHNQAGKDFYRKVIDLADEAKRKAKINRWGYFFDVLRRQLGYVPGKNQE